MEFINAACVSDPEHAEVYASFGDLFERKLWHELTGALDEFVKTPAAQSRPLLDLLEQFVAKFEQRMNQLRYAQLLAAVIFAAVDVSKASTAAEGIARLDAVVEAKRARLGAEASLYVELASVLLRLRSTSEGDAASLDAVRASLDRIEPGVKSMSGTSETAVFEKYYEAEAEYYKRVGPPELFYHAALKLLSYAGADAMTLAERRVFATDLTLAALTGDGVYNFGEVLATPILLEALVGTPNAWLGSLLDIFARGDIDAFTALLHDQRDAFAAQPALVARADFVKQKITLLALMNLIFETPSKDRTLAFATIADHVCLPTDQVEWLVMRAMSLGLVRGTIDQVDEVFDVSWVLPRVLDNGQIKHLIESLDAIAAKSQTASMLLTEQTLELL